ncbi:hypothetical protein [Anabaenopsis elenkinii]|uniref:Uncharacterized protein n=1 Tax=Anabaenopsis elenkinii CCIBt3563 TaxID=2779889 RepID=A0A7S6RC47_9CYAN|nr:hypothetical protein [Anabaenopsis elenkinii]QOV22173.1 hypothetical protein IM676_16005 [Anabaenopsis elenkinii CCIBt3563]
MFLPFRPYSQTIVLESYRATVANIVSDRTRLEIDFVDKINVGFHTQLPKELSLVMAIFPS